MTASVHGMSEGLARRTSRGLQRAVILLGGEISTAPLWASRDEEGAGRDAFNAFGVVVSGEVLGELAEKVMCRVAGGGDLSAEGEVVVGSEVFVRHGLEQFAVAADQGVDSKLICFYRRYVFGKLL